jgi:homoserine acetyltransferase
METIKAGTIGIVEAHHFTFDHTPSWQFNEITRFLMSRQQATTYSEIKSMYGHDTFLELKGIWREAPP